MTKDIPNARLTSSTQVISTYLPGYSSLWDLCLNSVTRIFRLLEALGIKIRSSLGIDMPIRVQKIEYFSSHMIQNGRLVYMPVPIY